jgi:hypothetical protein
MKIIKLLIFITILISVLISIQHKKSGPIILIGGSHIPEEAIVWMKQKSKGNNYLVITCNEEKSQRWINLLGPVTFVPPENFKENHLSKTNAIIIDGGDQWEYLNKLDKNTLQKAHNQGILILGTSAGAMILSEKYFSAENGTITSEDAKLNKNIPIGNDFLKIKWLKDCIVDTHFTERNRFERLEIFMKRCGALIGIGIDEQTALCIDHNEFNVFGKGSVTFINNEKVAIIFFKQKIKPTTVLTPLWALF